MKKNAFATLYILLYLNFAMGNNLSFSNGCIEESTLHFEISWDNAWNLTSNGGNKDAVWIFAKGKSPSGLWVHINLESSSTKHYASNPLSVFAPEDGKGVFIYSSVVGVQQILPTPISLVAAFNLSNFSEIRVFGIEMVQIPEGEFYMGDGVSISSIANLSEYPLLINSESSISTTDIMLINPNTQFTPQPLPLTIPEKFPKGFSSFYVMKYEISQIQYVDFLNTLTFAQQLSRTTSSPSSPSGTFAMINPNQPDSLYRNGIVIKESGSASGKPAVYAMDFNSNGYYNDDLDGLHRAANYINWADLSAYLDWAALRPMSEMEFEKACRGTNQVPVAGEFAWGTENVTNANNLINDGTIFEGVSDISESNSGLANYGTFIATEGWGLRGVLRTGFAAEMNSSRLEAGATYYGIMEMSGNVWEQTIMMGAGGEYFQGNLGDGLLDEDGNANQPSWCNPTSASGVLLKGGGWASTISEVGSWRDLAVSDRFYSHLKPTSRRSTIGGRGAR